MKKSFVKTLFSFFQLVIFSTAFSASAADCDTESFSGLACVAGNVIEILFYGAAAVLVIMVAYGIAKGSLSMGDPRGLEGAKSTWTYAVYGFLVIITSFTIFVLIRNAVGGTSGDYGGFLETIFGTIQELVDLGTSGSSGGGGGRP